MKKIVERLKEIERLERDLEEEALRHLSQIARSHFYRSYGCKDIYEFCMKVLNYSSGKANRRSSALKCLESLSYPEVIFHKLQSGDLTLTHLVYAQDCFKQTRPSIEKRGEILEKMSGSSTREAERLLVKEFGHVVATREKQRAVSETETQITVTIDQETLELLERFKQLSSHENPSQSTAEALKLALRIAVKAKDPSLKIVKHPPAPGPTTRLVRGNLRALVFQRARGRCMHAGCNSTYLLEVDHIVPVSHGGLTELGNLQLLCRAHHRLRDSV